MTDPTEDTEEDKEIPYGDPLIYNPLFQNLFATIAATSTSEEMDFLSRILNGDFVDFLEEDSKGSEQ